AATTGSFASAGAIPVGDHLDQLLADPRIASPDRIVRLVKPDSFMVLVSWIPMNAENASSLEFLAATLQDVYQRPVVIAEGPHYLHASGQMYKGGPGTGVFLIVSQEAEQDLPIPGAAYSLRQLYRALFGGDLDVMLSMGKNLASL
ncbi:MAG: hypothetical protein FWE46_06595, partial [Coriobacteriia bacterium]|nr:hypothetical protein [Coriobacteriia bacterium]